MSRLLPPQSPPSITFMGNDGLYHLHFRLWQIMMSAMTVLVSGWFVTFGVIPAILSLMIAKHVLVAILMIGVQPPTTPPRHPAT
jgi:hypothetical protein